MRTLGTAVSAALVLVLLAGCGGSDSNSTSSPKPTAQSAALVVKAQVDEVSEAIAVNEDNDPNDLIGRPNGYTAATVLVDDRAGCDTTDTSSTGNFGVDCGATIEQWPSDDDAQSRSDYIQELQHGNSILGSEYDTVRDNLLLRVSGDLKPSEAKEYAEVFKSADLAKKVTDATSEQTGEKAGDPWKLIDAGFGSQYGYAWVIARVRNNDDHAGHTVTVNFNLLDKAGELVSSGSQVSHFSWPGQVLPVATQVDVPKGRKPFRVEATLEVKDDGTFDDQTSRDLGTVRGKIYRPEFSDSFGARFEVANPTDEPLEGPSLEVVCTNRAGKIMGGAGEYPDPIPASGRVLVDVTSLYTAARPAKCVGYLAPWM